MAVRGALYNDFGMECNHWLAAKPHAWIGARLRYTSDSGQQREGTLAMEFILPVSLMSAAMFGLLALWLAVRTGRARLKAKVGHGDGGDALLARRMRAQLNFVESAPFVLALIVLIDLAGRGDGWLVWVALAYVVGRILHGIGMDADKAGRPRQVGTGITLLTLLSLSIVAALVGLRVV